MSVAGIEQGSDSTLCALGPRRIVGLVCGSELELDSRPGRVV